MNFNDGNLNFTPDKTIPLDVWQNKEFSFGLGVPDVSEAQKQIKYFTDYTVNYFNDNKETSYLNENSDRLWIWKNLGLIFSIGVVFDEDDKMIMDEIIKYFDKSQSSFIPCQYQVLNYTDDFVKIVEKNFGIDNGNYHYILIPFVMTDEKEELKYAPEYKYSSFGPSDVLQTPKSIVNYVIQINDSYGAVKSQLTPSVSNYLGINPNSNETNQKNYGDHGSVRTMNPTTFNWQQHGGNTKRIQRKGYIDPDSSDFYELINPQQGYERIAPNKNWGDSDELLDQNTTYRRNMNAYHRENPGVNMGWFNKEGYAQNTNSHRKNNKKSLYNQISEAKEGFKIIERPVDELKGIHLKMNDYYETNENKIEKPDYIIYESSETNLSGPDKFIDSVQQREKMPIGWGQKVEFNVPDNMVSRYENSNPIIRKYEEEIDSIIASNKITIQGLK